MSKTRDWADIFLATLADGSTVQHACKAARVGRTTAYDRRKIDGTFAAAWDDALEAGTDMLEEVAIRRGIDHSDTLLMFMLKARRPEKFKDRVQQETTAQVHHVSGPTAEVTQKAIGDFMDELANAKANGTPDEALRPAYRMLETLFGTRH